MLEKVQADRLDKLERIRQLGIDPYGGRYDTAEAIADILARYQDDDEAQTADAAGRSVRRPLTRHGVRACERRSPARRPESARTQSQE